MANLTDLGMAFTMASRTLKIVSKIKITPSISTAVNANCQLYPIVNTTVKAKNAFKPIPGANAKGSLAQKAMSKVATIEASAVVVNKAAWSMPVADKILGLTAGIGHRQERGNS